jgi:chemotaxis response regulator CheB
MMARRMVMVVDDARLMRNVIAQLFATDPHFEVVATCEHGQQGLDSLKARHVDLITVDLEMPVMDGLTFLRHAALKTKAKIMVLSSVAGLGSPKALEARKLGASAVIQKPSGAVSTDLVAKTGSEILATARRLVP